MSTSTPRTRKPSELIQRGYAEEEVIALYEMSRFLLESGDIFRAEVILKGLAIVAPDYIWPKTALSYISLIQQNFELAKNRADEALRISNQHEAMLYKITALLELGELSSAGSLLGELQDEENRLSLPAKRVLKILLAKFDLKQRDV